MKYEKMSGALLKFIPFVMLLCLQIFSLFRNITTIIDETERNIGTWAGVLAIVLTSGLLGNFYVLDRFSQFVNGETINIARDIMEKDSEDVSVSLNGFVGSTFFVTILGVLFALYIMTKNQVFIIAATLIAVITLLGTIISIIATYIQVRTVNNISTVSKMANPVLFPIIINLFLILCANRNIVGLMYKTLHNPDDPVLLSLSLIILLCVVLAVLYCFFSIVYCLVAFSYANKDLQHIQMKIAVLKEKSQKREDGLRQIARYIDEKAPQVDLIKRIALGCRFFRHHIRAFYQEKVYSISYLLLCGAKKITAVFNGLLEENRIRMNGIRFCAIVLIIELLALDMILFNCLESDNSCSRFFELLSTVIIIPILLSWLANLKEGK